MWQDEAPQSQNLTGKRLRPIGLKLIRLTPRLPKDIVKHLLLFGIVQTYTTSLRGCQIALSRSTLEKGGWSVSEG